MHAMTLTSLGPRLMPMTCADPCPGPGEVRLKVRACGVCRTDLHVIDGELPARRTRITPGHEVVGVIVAIGPDVTGLALGDRRGVPWLAATCGRCRYCRSGRENLCDFAEYTGWTRDGGYADQVIARAAFTVPIPANYDDLSAAPLLCAGLIGYRAWRAAGPPDATPRLGLYGFGAAAHLLAPLARFHGQSVYAFTRPGDAAAQALARDLGCAWAGGTEQQAPVELDAAILFAPAGELVPIALAAVAKGGTVVCGGIHMSDIPRFPYARLWGERRLVSVANLTRQDAVEYLPLAARAGIRPLVQSYRLSDANRALDDLRAGRVHGAAVLNPD